MNSLYYARPKVVMSHIILGPKVLCPILLYTRPKGLVSHIMLGPKFLCAMLRQAQRSHVPYYCMLGPKRCHTPSNGTKVEMFHVMLSLKVPYNGNKSCHMMGIFLENSYMYSGILIF